MFGQGEHEEAARCYEKAAEISPDDYQALQFLSLTYTKLGKRGHAASALRKSVENAKKHIAFHPDDVRALYLGAAGLVELGELDVAEEWVARAVEIDPDDALVLYNVACVYTQLGEIDTALDCLERSDTVASSTDALNWMRNDPDLDPLRDQPRFQALVEKAPAAD